MHTHMTFADAESFCLAAGPGTTLAVLNSKVTARFSHLHVRVITTISLPLFLTLCDVVHVSPCSG